MRRKFQMKDERNAETKQRLLDHQMETAVWPDAYSEKKPKETSFEHLGGRKLQVPSIPEKSAKSIGDFSQIGGRCVCSAPDASEGSEE
jgi:hypothetical protein